MKDFLDAIASRLNVRIVVEEHSGEVLQGLNITMQMFNYREVTDEVRDLFKNELRNHIFAKLQTMEVGESAEYVFDCGDIRPLGTLMQDANDNLSEVLLKLPTLDDEETYSLPSDTFICFTLTKKEVESVSIKPSVCPWIMEVFSEQ